MSNEGMASALLKFGDPDFDGLLDQVAPDIFARAEDDQGLITEFAEQGLLVRHPVNNLGTALLNPVGLRIGTGFSCMGIAWPKDRETVHAKARAILTDPNQKFAEWRETHAQYVKGMQMELDVRETVIEDEPTFLKTAPLVKEKVPEILVGNSELLAIMQRTQGEVAQQLEQLVFDILRHLVVERRMSYAHLYRISR